MTFREKRMESEISFWRYLFIFCVAFGLGVFLGVAI